MGCTFPTRMRSSSATTTKLDSAWIHSLMGSRVTKTHPWSTNEHSACARGMVLAVVDHLPAETRKSRAVARTGESAREATNGTDQAKSANRSSTDHRVEPAAATNSPIVCRPHPWRRRRLCTYRKYCPKPVYHLLVLLLLQVLPLPIT